MLLEAALTVMTSVKSVLVLENANHAKREPTSTMELVSQPAHLDSTPTKDHHHAAVVTKLVLNAVMVLPLTVPCVLPTTLSTRPLVFHNVLPINMPQLQTVTIVTQLVDHAKIAILVSLVLVNLSSTKESANNHAPTELTPTKTNNVLLVTEDVKLVSDH